jgi:hypothetical protein
MLIYCFVLLCILQLYCTHVYTYRNTRKYLFFRPIRNVSGAYFSQLVAHQASVAYLAICATHSLLMVHLEYMPLKGKLCVAHIEMRHAYFFTSGMTTVAHTICTTHRQIWCATNKPFSTSVETTHNKSRKCLKHRLDEHLLTSP